MRIRNFNRPKTLIEKRLLKIAKIYSSDIAKRDSFDTSGFDDEDFITLPIWRIKEIVLPNSVTVIKKRAFANTPLTEFVLSENITEVGFGIFAGCEEMVSVTLPFIGDVNSTESTIIHFGYAFGAETAMDHRRTNVTRMVPATLKNVTIFAGTVKNEAFFICLCL